MKCLACFVAESPLPSLLSDSDAGPDERAKVAFLMAMADIRQRGMVNVEAQLCPECSGAQSFIGEMMTVVRSKNAS